MNEACFLPGQILIPNNCDLQKWAVVACDQYSAQPEYWQRVRDFVGNAPSTLSMILPEAELSRPDVEEKIVQINGSMETYLHGGVLEALENSYVYVERTLSGGRVRRGLVGLVDLEAYEFNPGSVSDVRATEGTVRERIPPRVRVRENAPLELPHAILLADDREDALLGPLAELRGGMRMLYDFELMEDGGHLTGWQVTGAEAERFLQRLARFSETVQIQYPELDGKPMLFAVGDGNHSLATAKTCYETLKAAHPGEDFSNHPARWALAELENIHDPALLFEPIHRAVFDVDPQNLLARLHAFACAENGYPVRWFSGEASGTLSLDPSRSQLAVGVLQSYLDDYIEEFGGQVDYIHGEDVARQLAAKPRTVSFLLPAMEKAQLFRGVIAEGVLPRKTFSMGHANEKRFYFESRRIRLDTDG